MFLIFKLLRKFVMIITSQEAAWQIFLGVLLGTIMGMSSWWSWQAGPNYLTWLLLLVVLFIRVHLGSALLFMGIGKLLDLLLHDVAIGIGYGPLGAFTRSAAEQPLLYACHLSNTAQVGSLVLAIPLGLVLATIVTWAAKTFEARIRAKLENRRKLLKAAKAATPMRMRILCWFLGI